MKNVIQLKKASALEKNEYVLRANNQYGILIAKKIISIETLDGGKWIELRTEDLSAHILSPDELVVVVI